MGICPGTLNFQRLSAIKAILTGILDDQAKYHIQSAALMDRIERRLFTISTVLLIVSLLVFVTPWRNIELLVIVALAAMAVAIFGIRVTGDFEGQAERSEGAA